MSASNTPDIPSQGGSNLSRSIRTSLQPNGSSAALDDARAAVEQQIPDDGLMVIGFRSDSHRPPPSDFILPIARLASTYDRSDPDRHIWSLLASKLPQAEVFEFGEVKDARVISESRRGGELYYHNHLRLPYECVVYWYKHIGDPDFLNSMGIPPEHHTVRYATVALDATRAGAPSDYGRMIVAADFVLGGEGLTVLDGKSRTTMYMSCAGMIDIKNEEEFVGRMAGGVTKTSETAEKSQHRSPVGGLADGVLSLTMMLATRGIPLRKDAVSRKLNQKREKSGKPPLAAVTYVDAARYYQALENTERGQSHASRVPHLRRGHPRHYPNGYTRWIPDSLVNCRSLDEISPRDRYQIRH
jgi:hypothetical protein